MSNKKTRKKRANGEGTLYQKADKTWVLQICDGKKPDGSPDRKAFTGKTQAEVFKKRDSYREAKRKEQAEAAAYQAKCPNAEKDLTFVGWIERFLITYKAPPLTKETTYASYLYNLEKHIRPYFKDMLLVDIDEEVMQGFYTFKSTGGRADGKPGGMSPKSIYNLHIILHAALSKAVRLGKIPSDPSVDTKRPKVVIPEVRVLTEEEMGIFMGEVVKETQRTAILLDLFSGLRLGELLALEIADVDFVKKGLHVRRNLVRFKTYQDEGPKTKLIVQDTLKSGKPHLFVPLMDDLFNIVVRHIFKLQNSDWPNPNGLLFPSKKGTYIEPRSLEIRLAAVSKRCELKNVNPHALRHTFATRLVEQKVPLNIVQELLGHASIQTTRRYAHVFEDAKATAVNSLAAFLPLSQETPSSYGKVVNFESFAVTTTVATVK